jgi:hypothetical protein
LIIDETHIFPLTIKAFFKISSKIRIKVVLRK